MLGIAAMQKGNTLADIARRSNITPNPTATASSASWWAMGSAA